MNTNMERLKYINEVIIKITDKLATAAAGNREKIILLQKDVGDILDHLIEIKNATSELVKIHNYNQITSEDVVKRLKDISAPQGDMVNHPSHYKNSKYECIDVMLEVFGLEKVLAFCELNAFKYQWRANSKGTDIQDKEKAIWYNRKYIDLKKGDTDAE